MKNLFVFLITIILILNLFPSDQVLDDLIHQALINNPDIRTLNYQIEALQEKENLARKLMDPMLGIEYSNVPFESMVLDENPMSGIQFRLQQTIPFPGKNSARESISVSETESRKWDLEELKLQLTGKIKKAYYNLNTIRKLYAIAEEHISLLQQLENSLLAKYESGKLNQWDLLKTNMIIKKLKDDLQDYQVQEIEIQAAINTILNRVITFHIFTNDWIGEYSISNAVDMLLENAKKNRPLYKKIEQDIWKKHLEMKLIRKNRFPDLTLWAGYRYRQNVGIIESPDFISLGLSFPLPLDLFKHTKAKHSMFGLQKLSLERQFESTLNSTEAQIRTSLANLDRAFKKLDTYENELIPDARNIYELTLSGYETGQADFSSLYHSQLQILDFERVRAITQNNAIQHLISLEVLTGTSR